MILNRRTLVALVVGVISCAVLLIFNASRVPPRTSTELNFQAWLTKSRAALLAANVHAVEPSLRLEVLRGPASFTLSTSQPDSARKLLRLFELIETDRIMSKSVIEESKVPRTTAAASIKIFSAEHLIFNRAFFLTGSSAETIFFRLLPEYVNGGSSPGPLVTQVD